MLQQFFTDTLISKFIKALLKNTPLPIFPTVRDGDRIVEGCYYIYVNNIIKCTVSGIIDGNAYSAIVADEDVFVSNELLVGSGSQVAQYEVIDHYAFGESYSQITHKFLSKHGYYDSDTHYYLGQYLRCIRDIYNVNLMPFYNCFNYKVVTDCYLSDSNVNGYVTIDNSEYDTAIAKRYKVIAVPIKFNKVYTVAIDSSNDVTMKSVFYGTNGMLKARTLSGYEDFLSNALIEENGKPTTSYSHMQFSHPIVYGISSTSFIATSEQTMMEYEKNLHLLIQLPSTNKSSIVILEGDYTNLQSKKVFNAQYITKIPKYKQDELMLSPLTLLMINDGVSYAFSNRLIEYLLDNVITPIDDIFENVERIQLYANQLPNYIKTDEFFEPYEINQKGYYNNLLNLYYEGHQSGTWDDFLRVFLYRNYMLENENSRDINGYVDKNVEKYITKGRVV